MANFTKQSQKRSKRGWKPITLGKLRKRYGLPDLVGYFGYGSLVNRATHLTPVVHAVPARLHDHGRKWRPRPDMPGFPAALLTVVEAAGCFVDGLLIVEQAEYLPEIDAREARYDRMPLSRDNIEILGPMPYECPLYVYRAKENIPLHREPPLILQSYLDAVMQGFLLEHKEAGLMRFVQSTDGFEIGVHGDRHAPVYPRSVLLSSAETALFDKVLAGHGVSIVQDVLRG